MQKTMYFSHDFNARSDEKMLELRAEYGFEGYGIFWALIELMAEASGYKLSLKRIKGIAIALSLDPNKLTNFIQNCMGDQIGLFSYDSDYFWSETLLRRMALKDEKKALKSSAGAKGAGKRWQSDSTPIADPMGTQCTPIADPMGTQWQKIAKNRIEKKRIEKRKEINKEKKKDVFSFESLWEKYPNKDGRKEAERHFRASVKTEKALAEINRAIVNYSAHLALAVNSWKKPKSGATWFNNWRDWVYWKEPIQNGSGATKNDKRFHQGMHEVYTGSEWIQDRTAITA